MYEFLKENENEDYDEKVSNTFRKRRMHVENVEEMIDELETYVEEDHITLSVEKDHVKLSDPPKSLELVFSSQTSSSPVARPAIIPLSPLSVPLPGLINKTVSGKAANIESEEA